MIFGLKKWLWKLKIPYFLSISQLTQVILQSIKNFLIWVQIICWFHNRLLSSIYIPFWVKKVRKNLPKNFSFKLERYVVVLLIWACEYVLCHKSLYGREINFSLLELRNLPTRQLFSPWTYNKRRNINKRKYTDILGISNIEKW